MSVEIPPAVRQTVAERARWRCEYCLLPEHTAGHRHEPDHIIPLQHGGATDADNLALACVRCNRYKGPNIASYDVETGELTPFYNPRVQKWAEHFRFEGALIVPLTPEGRVTARIMRLNDEQRVVERRQLLEAGLYS